MLLDCNLLDSMTLRCQPSNEKWSEACRSGLSQLALYCHLPAMRRLMSPLMRSGDTLRTMQSVSAMDASYAVPGGAPFTLDIRPVKGSEVVQALGWTLRKVLWWLWCRLWRGCKIHLLSHEKVPVCVTMQDPYTRIVRLYMRQASSVSQNCIAAGKHNSMHTHQGNMTPTSSSNCKCTAWCLCLL